MDQFLSPPDPTLSVQNGRAATSFPPAAVAGQTALDSPSSAATAPCPHIPFDDEKRRCYCTLLRHGVPKIKAARLLGVAPRTIQMAVKNDPDLDLRVRQARLDCQSRAAAQVSRAGETNWRAAAWLLEQEKRRRGPGRPRKEFASLSDPQLRRDLKQLVRDVLLEVLPELRREITARRSAPSPLAAAASVAAESYIADRKARLSALAAEAKSIYQRGDSPDMDALWQKHLPGVPRDKTGSNGHKSATANDRHPTQHNAAQNLASPPAAPGTPTHAHFP